MPFADRREAAALLAEKLEHYRGQQALVLGIPRGGVVMAGVIAAALESEADVVLVHKLGEPRNPEVAIGCIDENGNTYLNEYAQRPGVTDEYIEEEKKQQLSLLRGRRELYTPIRPPIDPRNREVIVVDDGLATGSTMIGALSALRAAGVSRLVVAVGVAPRETLVRIEELADEVVCLEKPEVFFAVGQFFGDFSQVTDEEVIEILQKSP